jgi:predicted CoA-binding protein
MDTNIENFLNCKKIAVVGISQQERKFGNAIYKELKNRGFKTFAVSKNVKKIGDDSCYPNITSLQNQIDAIILAVNPKSAIVGLQEAASIGIKNVWIVRGAESPELIQIANELSIPIITKKCVLMYAAPVAGFHKFHRFINKVFGKY